MYFKHFELLQKKTEAVQSRRVGDYIKIGFLLQEGKRKRKRIQFFEGIIIAINGSKFDKKITIRKPGVERVFSCENPQIQTVQVLMPNSQSFRQSKLFYLRKLKGRRGPGAEPEGRRARER
uniref:Ribosomal protein L19 n=1 Tax=Rhipiliopsis peltata TaxID=2320810 RepID=A0A386B1D0_9CHLO|nr:ribosomal protein L19 [Rhipiliopsis peltata]AYC65502.1 ribosomal protein L19 [Rhipiliopsis peltata]